MNINSNQANNDLSTMVDPNKLHLFVKAGSDGRSQGACPFCQDTFMQLLIKAETNKFNFDVITINLDNPPKEFKELSIKPPVLLNSCQMDTNEIHTHQFRASSIPIINQNLSNAIILSDVDEIAEYLDTIYSNTNLIQANSDAKTAYLNVFQKFSHFIRDKCKQSSLENELEKINDYLKKCYDDNNWTYLCGNELSKFDCELLPRLQHIRIAAENIKQYRIPDKFIYIWKYLDNAYKTDIFQKSCPPDREIIWHWSKSNISSKDLLQSSLEAPVKTLTIPENIKI